MYVTHEEPTHFWKSTPYKPRQFRAKTLLENTLPGPQLREDKDNYLEAWPQHPMSQLSAPSQAAAGQIGGTFGGGGSRATRTVSASKCFHPAAPAVVIRFPVSSILLVATIANKHSDFEIIFPLRNK